jgi:aldose 1-epimerase
VAVIVLDPWVPLELETGSGFRASILPWGARLTHLGFAEQNLIRPLTTVSQWRTDTTYAGAIAGRVSGRIAGSTLPRGDACVSLAPNDGPHHLHGGPRAWDARPWRVLRHDRSAIDLAFTDPAGTNGYPGRVEATASIRIEEQALDVLFEASTDAATPLALTWHPYFNLGGDACRDSRDHVLQIRAEAVLAIDAALIPTGQTVAVADTPFDFRTPRTVASALGQSHPQLVAANGHDHTYVLERQRDFDARLSHPATGIALTLRSNQPSLQLYTGQWLPKRDAPLHGPFAGLCLEPQGFPDAVHHPHFPSPWLLPGERYRHHLRYEVSYP